MIASNTSIQSESDTSHRHLTIQVNWNLTFSEGCNNMHINMYSKNLHILSSLIQPNNSYSDLCQSRLKFMVDVPTNMIPDSYFTAKLFEHLEERLKSGVTVCKNYS